MKDFVKIRPSWSGTGSLVLTLGEQLERMQQAHQWQEDVLPPEEAW